MTILLSVYYKKTYIL